MVVADSPLASKPSPTARAAACSGVALKLSARRPEQDGPGKARIPAPSLDAASSSRASASASARRAFDQRKLSANPEK